MANQQYQQSCFKALASAAITINESDNVTGFSLVVVSGTCTIRGGGTFQGVASETITLSAGNSYTQLARDYSFLSGYVITAVGGTTNIDIKK